jgi:hypothetical protein
LIRLIALLLIFTISLSNDADKSDYARGFNDAPSGYLFIPVAAVGVQYADPLMFSSMIVVSAYSHKNSTDLALEKEVELSSDYISGYDRGRKVKSARSVAGGLILGIAIRSLLASF